MAPLPMRLAGALLALALAPACAAPAAPERADAEARGTDAVPPPSLEEIFLVPGIQGTPPRLVGLAADGSFALVRWSPPVAPPAEEPELRLLDLRDPAAPPGRGLPLAALLPPVAPDAAVPGNAVRLVPAGEEEDDEDPPDTAFAWSHEGRGLAVARGRALYLVDPAEGRAAPLVAWGAAPEEEEEVETAPEARARRLGRVTHVAFAPGDNAVRFSDGDELFEAPLPNALPAAPLGLADCRFPSEALEAPAMDLRWSRDLRVVAGADPTPRWSSDPVAQVVHLEDEPRAVLLEGSDGEREHRELAVSPDGRFVFALELDRDGEPPPALVPDYLTPRVSVREARRELADDGPRRGAPAVWRAETGARLPFPLGDAGEEPWWLDPVGWAPQPEPSAPARFALERVSPDHRTLELWCWTEGAAERVHVEHDSGWIGGAARGARWSADGRVLVVGSEVAPTSTTPGRGQLFALDPDTGVLRQLTEVEGEVTDWAPLAGGGVLFQFTGDEPAERHLGVVPAGAVTGDAPGQPVVLPTPPGLPWDARASRDGERVAFLHERLFEPAEVYAADRERAWRRTETVPAAFRAAPWVRPARIEVEAPDGAAVRAHVYLPPGTSLERPGAPRAAVVFAHGAGYLQNVTESMTRYPLNAMFHSRLASLGYPVIDVDFRGSAGYGRDFRVAVRGHLGGLDLDDVHLVVDELVRRGVVDPERVGIYGGSYGGFLALMALFTAPERWACGAALRPVTDWRSYHPRYTQPRLGRPSLDPEAYARSSPIDLVDGLEDPLLVCHGLVDSNVFAQDTIRLVEELIGRRLEFDAMLYPSQGHAFEDGEHWLDEYRRVERFLVRHLGPPLAGGEEER